MPSSEPKINLDQEDDQEKINLDTPATVPLSEHTLAERASKFSLAWPDSPSKPDHGMIRQALSSGGENDLRTRLSNDTRLADQQMKLGMVQDLAKYKADNNEPELSPEENNFIFFNHDEEKYDPNTVMEANYGRRFISNVLGKTTDPNHPFNLASQNFPQAFYPDADVASDISARNAWLQTQKQNNDSEISDEGWVPWVGQMAKGLAPFWQASDIASVSPEAQTSRLQPGTMLNEQLQSVWAAPTYQEFTKRMTTMLAGLDPMERSQVLDQALSFNGTNTALSNLGAVADVLTVAEAGLKLGMVGAGIARNGVRTAVQAADKATVAQAVKDYRASLDTVIKAPEGPLNPQNVLAKTGDVKTAARIGVIQRITKAFPMGSQADKLDLIQEIPSIFNFEPTFTETGNFAREATQRLMDRMASRADAIVGLLTDAQGASVNRLSQTALGKAFADEEAKLRRLFTGPNDAVMDVRHILADQDIANVNRVEGVVGKVGVQPGTLIHSPVVNPALGKTTLGQLYTMANTPLPEQIVLGRPTADFFENQGEAFAYAEWYGLKDGTYTVEPQGSGYYISIRRAVNETTDDVRNQLIDLENQNPVSFSNSLFGRWKSAEDVLPELQRANRHLALMAPNKAKEVLLRVAEPLVNMSRKDRSELLRLVTAGRDLANPDNRDTRGYFFRTVGEFEQAFSRLLGHPPTEAQADAYQAYVQLSDADYFIRNTALLRDKERQGIEQLSFRYHDGQQQLETPWFEGRIVPDLPWNNKEDFNVWRVDPKGKGELRLDRSQLKAEKELIENGQLKVLQVAHPPGRPLEDVTGSKAPIHFVLADNFDNKPLSPKQIEYNPGGHSIYEKPVYVKQPMIERGLRGRLHYYGDKVIFNFGVMKQAVEKAKILDDARLALREGRDADVAAILSRGVPMTTEQFKSMFREGFLSPDHPIVPVRAEQRAIDGEYNGKILKTLDSYNSEHMDDHVYSAYNLYNSLDKEFLQSKDAVLPTIKDGEREGSPIFQLSPAKQLDPFAALQRGLGGAIRQRWLNDYKTGAIEQWIEQFKGLFSQGRLSAVRGNPVYFFFHPSWKESNATFGDIQRAKAARDAIINFLGSQSELDEKLDWIRWKMMDGMYSALGKVNPRYAEKFANTDFVTNFLTPGKIDPARMMRNYAFHITIGMFNPMRYLLHAFYASHVLAIAGPTRAWQGMAASGLLQYMTMHGWTEDEQTIAHVAKLASNMGFGTQEEFKEMYRALRDSGWGIVGNETAWKQDILNPTLFKTPWGHFLDSGTWFFRKGEQFARLSAFGAAYKEWKAANPLLELTNRELGKILNRADTLSLNMTRASLAGWQKGLLSVPTQFATYNVRLLEQLLPGIFGRSSRISTAEAWRAVLTYSVLFGIPATIGGVVGFPAYESIKKAAMDRGISLDDSLWKQQLNDGLLSSALSLATGKHYNISERYGPNADRLFFDALEGEKSMSEILAGPSGAMIHSMYQGMMPGLRGMWDFATGKPDEYPIRPEDFLDAARRIGSVSQGFKAVMAAVAGKYYALNSRLVADNLDAYDGMMMGLTGSVPSEVSDNFIMEQLSRDNHAYQDKWAAQYTIDFQRALREFSNGNMKIGQEYLQRANTDKALGDFSPQQLMQIQRRAIGQEQMTVIQKTREDFWKYSPESKKAARQQYIESLGDQ